MSYELVYTSIHSSKINYYYIYIYMSAMYHASTYYEYIITHNHTRVLPEANLYSLREEIYLQLGDEIRLHYNFLRGVGRHLAKVNLSN